MRRIAQACVHDESEAELPNIDIQTGMPPFNWMGVQE